MNKKGEAVIGILLVGVVVGLFAAFVGNLKAKADAFNAQQGIVVAQK